MEKRKASGLGAVIAVFLVCTGATQPRAQILTGARATDRAWLPAAARQAAALIRSHQQPAGSWLTFFTATPRFEGSQPEVNTFLPAMVVDLLDPVAADAGVGESLDRARAYLRGQIEASGLVRYHGRPDGATIPSLGCAITPDADDTAFVWRVAGSDRPGLLPATLQALARYRSPEGLYRTWLAPRESYECIDPGKDPNPTDVGIQMHVLLLLAQSDPPSARALCDALRGIVQEDRVWVYYEAAPLVPLLRQPDLSKTGCMLPIPAARLRSSVSGQEIWIGAARMLEKLRTEKGRSPSSSETLALLGNLANDNFSLVHRNPPLLYHNDFTARTKRFYWSEDFGYALWLRLYLENERREHGLRAHS